MEWILKKEKDAADTVRAILALPNPEGDLWSNGEVFDPWTLFSALYGSYNGEFDELAIEVLTDLRDGTYRRCDLASEMFREMLCTSNLCSYGTSPRCCFPTGDFEQVLPELIVRWGEFARNQWGDDFTVGSAETTV